MTLHSAGGCTCQPKALVVEDTREVSRFLCRVLEMRGFVVEVAESVAEALELFDASPPTLVLADYHLPDGDGLSVLAHCAQLDSPQLTTALMSSAMEPTLARAAADLGAVAALAKPFSLPSLREVMELAINTAQGAGCPAARPNQPRRAASPRKAASPRNAARPAARH
jgi:DNA-binding response OmpR family regulator